MNGRKLDISMASFADTGQWKLIVSISYTGFSAYFKNLMEPDKEMVLLFQKEWDANSGNLLNLVEDTVYDNPRLLDDFATDIIICSPKSLWIPAELTDEEEFDEKFYTEIYPVAQEDISADFGGEEVCVYSIAPGLNSFLQRTLPGCRIVSHLTLLKREFQSHEEYVLNNTRDAASDAIYICCRNHEVDFLAFGNNEFLSASTHVWSSVNDIIYKALLITDAYRLKQENVRVYIIGENISSDSIADRLKDFFSFVSTGTILSGSEDFNLPLAPFLAAGGHIKFL